MHIPHQISYQDRLTNSSGIPIPDAEYQVTFTIWKDSVSRSPPDRACIKPDQTVTVVKRMPPVIWQKSEPSIKFGGVSCVTL